MLLVCNLLKEILSLKTNSWEIEQLGVWKLACSQVVIVPNLIMAQILNGEMTT